MAQQTNSTSFIAVIGAGTMGSGIAQKYAAHGHHVTIVDKEEKSLRISAQSINQSLLQGVTRKIFSDVEAKEIHARLRFTTDLTVTKNADLVVEAIFENLDLKRSLFTNLDSLCAAKTVLASNTSSLKIADLQIGLKYPERVLGLHYFYPPAKNKLVEIIVTDQTAKDAVQQAQVWQQSINKTAIHSKDSPGFIVNRFFVPWLNEAMRIVHTGIANVATVEKAAQDFFAIGMGPFALMNATGLPITLHSCEALAKALGDFYAPDSLIVPHIEKRSLWDLTGPVDEPAGQEIAMRLLAVVAVLSCHMVFQENVCTSDDVDVGANVGLLWKKGPFELIALHHREIAATLTRMKHAKNALPDTSAFDQFCCRF